MCVKCYRSIFVLYSCENLSFDGWKHPSAAGGLLRNYYLTLFGVRAAIILVDEGLEVRIILLLQLYCYFLLVLFFWLRSKIWKFTIVILVRSILLIALLVNLVHNKIWRCLFGLTFVIIGLIFYIKYMKFFSPADNALQSSIWHSLFLYLH